MSIVSLRNASSSVTVDLDGGRLTSLVADGLELLGAVEGVTSPITFGSFVMAPWAGRIRRGLLHVGAVEFPLEPRYVPPHAGHGLVLEQHWRVEDADDTRACIVADIDPTWPWRGTVTQDIELRPDALVLHAAVHASDEPFPADLGWHPWLRTRLTRDGVAVGEHAVIDLAADGVLVRDDDGIPSGAVAPLPAGPLAPGAWDDCFTGVRWPVTVTWPGALRLSVDADTDYAVVFNERTDVWCVEPQTGPPDGPNTHPRWARPGEPVAATTTWSWTRLG